MGWIAQKIGNWATKTQKAELEEFVARLKAMDSSELGFVLAIATDRRHALKRLYGWDLLEPQIVEMQDVAAAMKLSQLIRSLQKERNLVVSAGLMVWLHTLRSGNNLDLRMLGRQMWGELSRGHDAIFDAALGFQDLGGEALNLDGYDSFPGGLTPQPV